MSGTPLISLPVEAMPLPLLWRPHGTVPWEGANEAGRHLLEAWRMLDPTLDPGPVLERWALRLRLEEGELLLPGLDPEHRRKGEQYQSFGRYTGGIVHNLNNPLNALSGMLQLMMFRNSDLPELPRLEAQGDELAAQIRHLGERYRRLREYERGTPLAWELVLREELRFYRADAALKHRCRLVEDIPADVPCPLSFREASWLVDRLLEAVLLLAPQEEISELRVDLDLGWPRFRLPAPDLGSLPEAVALLAQPLMVDLLAGARRRLLWQADADGVVAGTLPLL